MKAPSLTTVVNDKNKTLYMPVSLVVLTITVIHTKTAFKLKSVQPEKILIKFQLTFVYLDQS